jgi:hypothetical protein
LPAVLGCPLPLLHHLEISSMLIALRQDVPLPAFILGFLGAVPFVGLALLAVLAGPLGSATVEAWALVSLLAYGAIILSFMGGVHWGWAMAAEEPSFERLGLSVVPALLGWGGYLFGGSIGFLVIAAGFAALLWLDLRAITEGRAASWYRRLRWPLTVIVVGCLVVASVIA